MNATETRKRSDKNPRRKRSYIINPVFQWKYTLLISGSVFFISTFMCVILFGALDAQLRARLVDPRASHMWENTLVMLFSAVSFSILTAGAVGFWSIFLTHRVAGPMYVLERYCREIIVGRLPTVRALRRKDEFKELHEIFRKAVETLRMRQQGDLDVLTETLTIARSSAEEHEKGHKHALEEIAGRIEGLRTQAAEVLGEQADSLPPEPNKQCETTSRSEQPCAEVRA